MRVVLFLLSILVFGLGVLILSSAVSALHEIEAGICFLVGATLLAGAGVCDAMVSHSAKIERTLRQIEARLRKD